MTVVAERTLTMSALLCSPCYQLPTPHRYNRLYRTNPPSPSAKTRPRRSLSTDSYGLGEGKDNKELTAGQKKAAEDKKGSRHADVIDTWDPTGLGSASKSPLLPPPCRLEWSHLML